MGILCGKEKGKSFAWFESAFPDKLTWIIHTVPVSADVILYQPAFQTTGTDSVHRSEIYANMWKRLSLTGRQCDNIPHSKWKEQWLTTLKVNTSCHRFLHRHRVSIASVTFGKKSLALCNLLMQVYGFRNERYMSDTAHWTRGRTSE